MEYRIISGDYLQPKIGELCPMSVSGEIVCGLCPGTIMSGGFFHILNDLFQFICVKIIWHFIANIE